MRTTVPRTAARCLLAVAVLGVSGLASTAGGEPPYVWPLAESDCITSTFCDYRDGHFHAGIDLSTGGREGLAVRAADCGWVSRARASCGGYGKVVYLRLDDGRTAVYAHLSRFSPAVARVVRRGQEKRGSYEVDLSLDPGDVRVARGEIIGYTGQTGAGPPHLHFELRDEKQHPVNPLTNGVIVDDTLAPVLTGLILRPMDHLSFVNGTRNDLEVDLRWSPSEGCYAVSEDLICSGRVGVLIEGYDRVNACVRDLSLSAAQLVLDGSPLFKVLLREFSYDETGRIDTYYDRSRRRSRGEEFHRLYRDKGNGFSFSDPHGDGAGLIRYESGDRGSAGPGRHRVEIRVPDASGNTAEARFDLVLNKAPAVGTVDVRPAETGLWVTVEADDPEGDELSVRVRAVLAGEDSWVERRAENLGGSQFKVFLPGIDPGRSVAVAATATDVWGSVSPPAYVHAGVFPNESEAAVLDIHAGLGSTLDYLDVSVTSPVPLVRAPRIWFPDLPGDVETGRIEQVEPLLYRAIVPLTREFNGRVEIRAAARTLGGTVLEGRHDIRLWNISPEAGGRLECMNGEGSRVFTADIEPGKAYRDLWLLAGPAGARVGSGEIRPVGIAVEIVPMDAIFDGRVAVEMHCEDAGWPADRMGILSAAEDSDWEWVGGDFDAKTGMIRGRVQYLVRFCLGVDTTAPGVRVLKPPDGAHLPARGNVFRARVSDQGSGLGCESVGMDLDGEPLITEFDPELDLVAADVGTPLSTGRHVLRVWAEDRAGNPSEATSAFWVD